MIEWINKRMNEGMNESMNERMNAPMCGWMYESVNEVLMY